MHVSKWNWTECWELGEDAWAYVVTDGADDGGDEAVVGFFFEEVDGHSGGGTEYVSTMMVRVRSKVRLCEVWPEEWDGVLMKRGDVLRWTCCGLICGSLGRRRSVALSLLGRTNTLTGNNIVTYREVW